MNQDYWRLKFRLENVSGEDLIVYGRKNGDAWDFIDQVQYRNPHVCEWQFSTGEMKRRVSWKDMRPHEKMPRVLKAGESIESERGIGVYDGTTPTRFVAFVGKSRTADPVEIMSLPYVKVEGPTRDKPSYRIVGDDCKPQCTIDLNAGPSVRGVKLGMSLNDFTSLFPSVKISALHADLANFKVAYIYDSKADAWNVGVSFLDDRVGSIRVQFKSLDGVSEKRYEGVAERIGLPYWKPYRSGWECHGFVVDVVPNTSPTITVQTKEFIKVHSVIVEQAYKKKK